MKDSYCILLLILSFLIAPHVCFGQAMVKQDSIRLSRIEIDNPQMEEALIEAIARERVYYTPSMIFVMDCLTTWKGTPGYWTISLQPTSKALLSQISYYMVYQQTLLFVTGPLAPVFRLLPAQNDKVFFFSNLQDKTNP